MKISFIFIIIFSFFNMYGEVSAEPCTLKFIVKNYKEGLTQYKKQNYRNALMRWVPLAEAGLGPAQRQIALMYATGTGLEKSMEKARFWARLAHQGGDKEGRRLDNEFGINLTSNINLYDSLSSNPVIYNNLIITYQALPGTSSTNNNLITGTSGTINTKD